MDKRARKVVDFANRQLSVKAAAMLLAGSILLSSLLGIYRSRLLNGYYLDTYPTGIDAYTVAFIIPDFMFSILVSGALTVTFMPVFNQLRNDRRYKDNRKAWELTSSLLNLMSLVSLVISILIMIFAEPLIKYVVGPGLDEASRALAASMMRVIAINPLLFSISSITASLQQAYGRYVFYAVAPAVYNLGIIIGIIFFTDGINFFGWQIFEGGIMGVALGVLFGSILQLVVSSIGIIGLGFQYDFKIHWNNEGFRKVLRIFPARSLDQGADYLNSLVETRLASEMTSGTITAYNQAIILHSMPINLIGVAISNAAFASMTEKLSLGQTGQFKHEVQAILRTIIWIALPVTVIAFFTRGYLVSFVKNGGNSLIAGLFGALIVAVFFRSVYHILARTFYAQQDTKTPFYVSLVAITINIGLAIYFTRALGFDAYGLAWSQSITAIVEVMILSIALRTKVKGIIDREFMTNISKMLLSALITGIVCYILVLRFPFMGTDQNFFAPLPKLLLIIGISLATYLGLSKIFHLSEVDSILNRLKQILFPMPKERHND
ncbi:MAG: murein biosynthesis integral membrane protein MurJ [Candidatus Saccharibacteria bacterium]|nr:murein biosynthesis integral membrane protein MurJ [Candidatus Saccharibacteria bacterium]